MAIDPSLPYRILQPPTAINPDDLPGGVNWQAKRAEADALKLKAQQQRQDFLDKQTIRQIAMQSGGDLDVMSQKLRQFDPLLAAKFDHDYAGIRDDALKYQEHKMNYDRAVLGDIASVDSQEAYDKKRLAAQKAGYDISTLPPTWSPDVQKALRKRSMTTAELLHQEEEDRRIAADKAKEDREANKPIKIGENLYQRNAGGGYDLVVEGEPKQTDAAMKAKAVSIRAAQARGLPVSVEDQSFLKAYDAERTLPGETAAAAAANRQAAAIAAQVAQQGRAQTFSEAQAGRRELTEKVEQPYQTALTSAQTLRDAVAAAKAGNKTAAALQNLEATMAAIRAQGLNRINMSEIGVTANAGSLWDRIQSAVGKATSGQPVPDNIQKDMEQFAGILEKAAYKKYKSGFDSVTKRYGLKDEKPEPEPSASAPGITSTSDAAPDLIYDPKTKTFKKP